MKLTVFTPTYNWAYIIENLYRSLQRQTCRDFEWLELNGLSATHKCWIALAKVNFELCCTVRNKLGVGL